METPFLGLGGQVRKGEAERAGRWAVGGRQGEDAWLAMGKSWGKNY